MSEVTGLPDEQIDDILADLAAGRCASVFGLSNTGKSTLLRSLARQHARYEELSGRPGVLIYVDCNRAVATSPQAFYEVVLRTILEELGEGGQLREHYEAVTEAETGFAASLSFNLALTELCETLGKDLCLLLDEFDELYRALDDRGLLNLRALRDRFQDRLRYATATVRQLPELRGHDVEGEFAEMFARAEHAMELLAEPASEQLLEPLALEPEQVKTTIELAGGHPGLLLAIAHSLSGETEIQYAPRPRAECMKVWSQLSEQEQASLASLTADASAGLPAGRERRLRQYGLIRDGQLFSPLFRQFVQRRTQTAAVAERGIDLDLDSGDVFVDGMRIPVLTDLEFRLIKLLYDRRDKITDKYKIVEGVWGEDYLEEVDDARVEKLVSRLRSKIEADPSSPQYLTTLRGRGYKLSSQPYRN
jgi:hypothetical protein